MINKKAEVSAFRIVAFVLIILVVVGILLYIGIRHFGKYERVLKGIEEKSLGFEEVYECEEKKVEKEPISEKDLIENLLNTLKRLQEKKNYASIISKIKQFLREHPTIKDERLYFIEANAYFKVGYIEDYEKSLLKVKDEKYIEKANYFLSNLYLIKDEYDKFLSMIKEKKDKLPINFVNGFRILNNTKNFETAKIFDLNQLIKFVNNDYDGISLCYMFESIHPSERVWVDSSCSNYEKYFLVGGEFYGKEPYQKEYDLFRQNIIDFNKEYYNTVIGGFNKLLSGLDSDNLLYPPSLYYLLVSHYKRSLIDLLYDKDIKFINEHYISIIDSYVKLKETKNPFFKFLAKNIIMKVYVDFFKKGVWKKGGVLPDELVKECEPLFIYDPLSEI